MADAYPCRLHGVRGRGQGLCDRYAERGLAVQDADADLELCDLTIEVARHQALAREDLHPFPERRIVGTSTVTFPRTPGHCELEFSTFDWTMKEEST
ncbi:hypothetical protein [Rhodovulum sulfidophilum]|uniref:hypothetical protein n=1 Tax=Rhodovulum sulfidophilum TaxID=35806 RepID=UPI00138A1AC4|nr:hypothetical protein [Rhodovulum sulfidophilum]